MNGSPIDTHQIVTLCVTRLLSNHNLVCTLGSPTDRVYKSHAENTRTMRVGVIWEELIIMVALPNECFYKRGYSLVISASLSFHCEPFTHYQLLFIHRVFLSVCASERLLNSWLMIEIRVMVVRLTGQTYLLPLLSMILRRQFDVLEPAAC